MGYIQKKPFFQRIFEPHGQDSSDKMTDLEISRSKGQNKEKRLKN
jgi:hypothetical protein